ncbi:unnamed protein product, partial [Mesorhabditis belari]|uniref:Transthyretin-like family protein n=1 Tax=Mesorhabditis belari TaxID=2138241 RepID=A0AAF3J825_9BILA
MLLVFATMIIGALASGGEIEIPEDVAVRTVGVKGKLMCGTKELQGSTKDYPKNETQISPWISIHHQCEEDLKSVKQGYRRFNMKIPDSYVLLGNRPHRLYDFGTLNLELGVHAEYIDKNYIPNPNAKLTDERPGVIGGEHDRLGQRRTTVPPYDPYRKN